MNNVKFIPYSSDGIKHDYIKVVSIAENYDVYYKGMKITIKKTPTLDEDYRNEVSTRFIAEAEMIMKNKNKIVDLQGRDVKCENCGNKQRVRGPIGIDLSLSFINEHVSCIACGNKNWSFLNDNVERIKADNSNI